MNIVYTRSIAARALGAIMLAAAPALAAEGGGERAGPAFGGQAVPVTPPPGSDAPSPLARAPG